MSIRIRFGSVWTAICLLGFSPNLHADHASDCLSLISALLHEGKDQNLAVQMLDPKAGKDEHFISPSNVPWIGYYFPFERGGIAVRWQGSKAPPAKVLSEELQDANPSVTQAAVIEKLRRMTKEERHHLSPAEKMDIYLGRYDFPITLTELVRRGPRRVPSPRDWEGFCNGRCAAGMLTHEPTKAVTVVNADGIELTFEPNDIKALVTASYFYVEKYAQMGAPNMSTVPSSVGRVDAAAFDMALRAFIGESERPFVVDIDPRDEIWNHLAVGYKRSLGVENPVVPGAAGVPSQARFEVSARMTVYYINDVHSIARHNTPTVDLVRSGDFTAIFPKNYPYKLYLDDNKRIVGGAWDSDKQFPDFAWFPAGRGTDDLQGANPFLPFDKVMALVDASSSKTLGN